jgi:polyprenyldihydroxybenzoate methyltransferase / 3-demethylubiquinol 3-O-methyltransferase
MANRFYWRLITTSRNGLLAGSKTAQCISGFSRHHSSASSASVSADEVSHFSALAGSWWDPMGPSRVLHLMNPLRHDFIASCLADSHPPGQGSSEETNSTHPVGDTSQTDKHNHTTTTNNGLRYLDVGCGGGIFAESLARTIPVGSSSKSTLTASNAASVLAIDPSSTLIRIAQEHGRIDPTVYAHLCSGHFRYENTTIEALTSQSMKHGNGSRITDKSSSSDDELSFDVITLFEVLEHVDPETSSPLSFLMHCLQLLRPGGWLIGSTIARTLPSYLVNKVVAEAPWPVGVVPRGTHEWNKFVNADELKGWVEEGLISAENEASIRSGSEALEGMRWKCTGVVYVPGLGWKMVNGGENWGNYFWAVRKRP